MKDTFASAAYETLLTITFGFFFWLVGYFLLTPWKLEMNYAQACCVVILIRIAAELTKTEKK